MLIRYHKETVLLIFVTIDKYEYVLHCIHQKTVFLLTSYKIIQIHINFNHTVYISSVFFLVSGV
jgi:hypothetical protein